MSALTIPVATTIARPRARRLCRPADPARRGSPAADRARALRRRSRTRRRCASGGGARQPSAATITAIDTAAAGALPGVLGVWTGADVVAAGLGGIPWELAPPGAEGAALGDPAVAAPQPLLARDRVRYQGEPVAAVVARPWRWPRMPPSA